MDEDKLREIVQGAVKQAFKEVGLHDETAGEDVRDLRSLIQDWRETKRTIWNTIARWGTLMVLGLLSIGAWNKLNGGGGE